ncbi:MAG TPA: patatin-like phospholipase family protein [Gemmatimonadaceae bacterium]|nr:patatin-like phospholipase family protein [Gemmatimonadaceae bacterium]
MSSSRRSTHRRRIALVLGGGGLKGLAHVGVLRAMEEQRIVPTVYAGTSIGALIAAARAAGMPLDDMERRALALNKRGLFRINHVGMLLSRMRAPSIYMPEPLRALVDDALPDRRIDELPQRLLVNTVDLRRGTQVVWGMEGLRQVRVRDAVFASCALPGYFPPGAVDGRTCVDGGVVDNLPVNAAAVGMDAVIAVDVGSSEIARGAHMRAQGFADVYMRAATVMMHALQAAPLDHWTGPPMLLIRPRVAHIPWMSFAHTEELIAEGYRAATKALSDVETALSAAGGVWPRLPVRLTVDPQKCIGCGLCAALAPRYMGMDRNQKAFARTQHVDWSPADGEFVHHCPTLAIEAVRQDGRPHIPTEESPAAAPPRIAPAADGSGEPTAA